MLFTDPCFLFLLLPVILTVYYCSPRAAKNYILLAASIVFYALGEGWSTFVVIASIIVNFFIGAWIDSQTDHQKRKGALIVGVVVNLAILCVFKYAAFVVNNISFVVVLLGGHALKPPKIHLPLGISFFTFHALSYIIDVFRQEVKPMKRPSTFGLYIMLFPQLIAGPIIRFKTICDQFTVGGPKGRHHNWDIFSEGVKRFIIGFGKKMLIANTVAQTADTIFTIKPYLITPSVAWLGVLCYTIQIYFDFSGYTDMAIGLGKMFGFVFPENFNYPYISSSITDFWRRWHITLSSWLRDYLYIPLGGNRVSKPRLYFNLLTVFFLCGLWHGATWTFVVWGLYHGFFLIIERVGLREWLERHKIIQHVYLLLVVMVGWVFFRADDFSKAFQMLTRMAFLGDNSQAFFGLNQCFNPTLGIALIAGILGSLPLAPFLDGLVTRTVTAADGLKSRLVDLSAGLGEFAMLAAIFIASTALSAAGTYNPFIYFRF
jgi:alginate O-acetyltransferase complex protein AlgI